MFVMHHVILAALQNNLSELFVNILLIFLQFCISNMTTRNRLSYDRIATEKSQVWMLGPIFAKFNFFKRLERSGVDLVIKNKKKERRGPGGR